ncbi:MULTISPECIES: NUDIX domain-containing protein [unclassified Streptomyces]|uniref:NUDIX domain-containing protein n=1 Tax=unclassified Streptomyces TaxID=2593676 RepID=UPI000709DC6B|nr:MULTISPECIES: NUDIX domain-containing protein [unclassified Streptomyces]KRD23281.1 NUDIX hydrolase [Streptomyces sp. Root264]
MDRFARALPAALMVIPGPDGTVTFIRQLKGPYANNWLLPGGGIEPGEPAEAAALREAREETGIAVRSCSLFAVYEFTGTWEQGGYHLLMFAFLADGAYALRPGFAGDNVGAIRQARIGEIDMHSTDLQILTDAGLASYDEETIARALAADGITMHAHRVASTARCGAP